MGEEQNPAEKKNLFGRLFTGSKPAEQDAQTVSDKKPGEEVEAEIASDQDDVASTESQVNKENGAPVDQPMEADAPKQGWFAKLKSGLTKSSTKLTDNITGIFTKAKLDDDTLEQLEDILIQSDLGVDMAMRITDALSASRYNKDISADEVQAVLADEVEKVLQPVALPLKINQDNKPHILLMIGVNGSGKTTTIGKLASQFRGEGKSLTLAAADTFRAAAIEQLKVWGERTKSNVVARETGADSAGLVYDAIEEASNAAHDIVMIDTAGRLQNKSDLMAELEKIVRVIKKFDETAPHDVILVLDATTGQNALNQVEIFQKTAGVTGLVMTKLDGTARGGILVAIADKFKLPIHAIGVGEGIDDLQAFDPKQFATAIANR